MTKKTIYNVVRFKGDSAFVKRVRLEKWDVDLALSMVKDPQQYRYFWFEEIELTCERGDGIFSVRTKVLRNSNKYFINSYIETYEDMLVHSPEVAKQMTNLGWKHVARSIDENKNWTEHFKEGVDQIITGA